MNKTTIFRQAQSVALSVAIAVFAATSAQAQTSSALTQKPDYWPSKYKWYDYKQTAPQPVYEGKVQFIKKKGWTEAINFKTLPLQHAIVRVRGTGERKIAIFTDPTCPYSSELERNINKLNNVTIYTFVLPMLNNKRSRPLSEQIACQPTNQERAQAYEDLALNRTTPQVVAPCANAIDKVLASLDGLVSPMDGYIYAKMSPTIVYDNNGVMSGALKMSDILDDMADK